MARLSKPGMQNCFAVLSQRVHKDLSSDLQFLTTLSCNKNKRLNNKSHTGDLLFPQ